MVGKRDKVPIQVWGPFHVWWCTFQVHALVLCVLWVGASMLGCFWAVHLDSWLPSSQEVPAGACDSSDSFYFFMIFLWSRGRVLVWNSCVRISFAISSNPFPANRDWKSMKSCWNASRINIFVLFWPYSALSFWSCWLYSCCPPAPWPPWVGWINNAPSIHPNLEACMKGCDLGFLEASWGVCRRNAVSVASCCSEESWQRSK